RGPAAGDAAAEDRRAEHGAFEAGTAVDMAARHAASLARPVEPRDRLKMLVEDAATQVGLDAAEILARQREDLDRVIRCRVERLGLPERLAEFRLPLEPVAAGLVVALDRVEEGGRIDPDPFCELRQRIGLADVGRV